jgi:Fic family protein
MEGWGTLTARVVGSAVDPVVAAAVSSFAFVFVHPFSDGNGRIHRFLMHHVLAKRGYSPDGVIFPVSAAILRDRRSYDQALETFSKPLFDFIRWHWTSEQEVVVTNDTGDLYRYFDATVFAEYLYDRVGDTVRHDLKEELGFVAIYDRAFATVREIVDMPDRRASLLVRLCMQNGGRLSATKRAQFSELTDAEVVRLETQVQQAIATEEAGHPNPVK